MQHRWQQLRAGEGDALGCVEGIGNGDVGEVEAGRIGCIVGHADPDEPSAGCDQPQRGYAHRPAPQDFERRKRGPRPHRRHHMHERLRSPHLRARAHDFGGVRLRHYFTTRFTSLPFTTMVLTTVLPAIRATTFSSPSAAALRASSSASAATFTTVTSLPLSCTGISISLSRASSALAAGQGWRRRLPSLPICSHNSAAMKGAKGASRSVSVRKTSAVVTIEISPESMAASCALISLTRIMMAAMEVLKCQRPPKSSVILAMAW